MYSYLVNGLEFINQLLTAGIAITAFSLLLYALTFNLQDRVARTFVIILICVVIVFVCDALYSTASTLQVQEFWLRMEWVGILFLPPAYLHFSDAMLETTGRPSRGRRKLAYRLAYLISFLFLLFLGLGLMVGPVVPEAQPAPYLERTWLTWLFSFYYVGLMVLSWVNLWRAKRRTITSASQRRMRYMLAGSLAPALGSYPFLLFGSALAAENPLLFWTAAVISNVLVAGLLVVMAYSVAFFGVSWPDRVVKRRLFKWLMRGPVTASTVLAVTTVARRVGLSYGLEYSAFVPVIMIVTLLIMEYAITLAAPVWERWLFHGGDQANMRLLQTLDERLLTSGDLHQFLEAILAAICDRLQAVSAFIVGFHPVGKVDTLVQVGGMELLPDDISTEIINLVTENGGEKSLFTWGNYWLLPLHYEEEGEELLVGIIGVNRAQAEMIEAEMQEDVGLLRRRAALALQDRYRQQEVFNSLASLTPQIDLIQRLRAASRYDGSEVLSQPELTAETSYFSRWVKEALTHYWGGPKLTSSPLMRLKIVQAALQEHQGNPVNALRSILREAVEQVRPEGERRFTGEWVLYNILEMKFMEGHKVREIAQRLAVSEADLYRKQRVAIEAVAKVLLEMEQQAGGNSIVNSISEELPKIAR